jgi:hypothetical protein
LTLASAPLDLHAYGRRPRIRRRALSKTVYSLYNLDRTRKRTARAFDAPPTSTRPHQPTLWEGKKHGEREDGRCDAGSEVPTPVSITCAWSHSSGGWPPAVSHCTRILGRASFVCGPTRSTLRSNISRRATQPVLLFKKTFIQPKNATLWGVGPIRGGCSGSRSTAERLVLRGA